ncbi:hypothetical protein TNCV_25731 [Trichonephila clavipes]|uniref:Uncharacterized protein n=1 Tax=Trichonephila clavipes TaxID=2585209 RepID=A0A8X6W1U3_TRICX|nr:hypothetical protein TNCV_25731 [Trichonephila clavipes]
MESEQRRVSFVDFLSFGEPPVRTGGLQMIVDGSFLFRGSFEIGSENHFNQRFGSQSSPPSDATAYQLLYHLINRQAASMVAKNNANLALSPSFRNNSIESPL